MSMTPKKIIQFYRDQLSQISIALDNAVKKKNHFLVALNYGEKFKANAMIGLLEWRHAFDKPLNALNNAAITAEEASDSFENLGLGGEHWKSFNFSLPLFIYTLLNKEPPKKVRAMLYDLKDWKTSIKDKADTILETVVIRALFDGELFAQWDEITEELAKKKRLSHLNKTFRSYMSLIDKFNKGDYRKAGEYVLESEKLFDLRANNGYYSGGLPFYGGGPDNKNVVDFVLAAIVQHCRKSNPDFARDIDSVHLWRW